MRKSAPKPAKKPVKSPKAKAKKVAPKTEKTEKTEKPEKISLEAESKINGGRRPGSGRKPGVQNRVTRELKEAAQVYTVEALEILIKVARKSRSDAARVAACNALLDRGHGKPKQQIEAETNLKITLGDIVNASFHPLPEHLRVPYGTLLQ